MPRALPSAASVSDDAPACAECSEPIALADGGLCEKCRAQKRSDEGDQLAGRLSVSELVAIYERAERDIRAGFQLVARAQQSLCDAFTLDSTHGISIQGYRDQVHFNDPEQNLKLVRQSIWKALVDRLELRRFMSIAAWNQLEKQLGQTDDVPEITEETVSAMARQFTSQLPQMLEAAIGEVFNWLRPPNSRFKRNSELEIPARIALEWVVEVHWHNRDCLKVRYHDEPRMTALENVFTALDGRGSVTKTHYSALSQAIEKTPRGAVGETEYFRFRGFKNGALHLEFKRIDLLKRFNQIAGGARLRPKAAP